MSLTHGSETPTIGALLRDRRLATVLLIAFTSLFGSGVVPVILSEIGTEFGIADSRIGTVMTAFYLPQIAMIPLVGVLSDLYGRRSVVIPSLFVFGIAGVATLTVESYELLLLLRAAQGVGFAGLLPLTNVLVGDIYTGASGAAAQGLRSSVAGLANLIAPVAAGALAVVAWNIPFLAFALVLPVTVLAWRHLPDVADHDRVRGGLYSVVNGYVETILTEFHDRTLVLLSSGGFVLFFIIQAIRVYVPLFVVRDLGASVLVAGVVLSVYGVVRVIVSPFSGRLVAAIGRPRTLFVGLGIMIVGTVLISTSTTVFWLTAMLAVYTFGEAIFNPVLNDGVAELASDERRGGVMSVLNMLKQTANAVSPPAFGLVLVSFGLDSVFLTAAGFMIVFLLVLVRFLDPSA